MMRREQRLHLRIVGVEGAADERGVDVGLDLAQAGVVIDDLGSDAELSLMGDEGGEARHARAAAGDDEAALRFELPQCGVLGEIFAPHPLGVERQLEFGAHLFVGDEDVAFAPAAGARRDRAALDDDRAQARCGGEIGGRGTDDPRTDDHDVGARCRGLH